MAALNDEQTMLRDMARDWSNEKSPVSAFRKMRAMVVQKLVRAHPRSAPSAWHQSTLPHLFQYTRTVA